MDERSARWEKRLQLPLLVAAVLTIPVTILQASRVVQPWASIAAAVNWLIWAAFLAEVVIMLAVVPSRTAWLRRHPLDLVIVVFTFPLLSVVAQSLRILRVLRLVRLLRLGPLFRFVMSGEGLRYVVALAVLVAVAGGAGFSTVEKNVSVGTGIYWAITTMTTVGYGDVYPHTTEGRVLAVVVMLVGIGTASILIGAVAQRFVTAEVGPALEESHAEGEDVLAEVREIAARLQRVQALLEHRRSGS